ncbi:hypothetical protein ABZP36_012187 [Zizania latifolia]
MTSSLSSTAACSNSSNPPPAPHSAVSRRKLLFFSAAATSGGLAVLPPASQANPFAAAKPSSLRTSTPYSQSQQFGLDGNGRIRPCPSTNPGCVSTNPTVGAACSLASPLLIPLRDKAAAAASLRQAIMNTQRNAVIRADEETAYGHYIQAEVDGGLTGGRDIMEFLIREQQAGSLVAVYRCVATKVTFVYPFTTAVGDSKGQSQRIAAVSQELGWYAPDLLQDAADE